MIVILISLNISIILSEITTRKVKLFLIQSKYKSQHQKNFKLERDQEVKLAILTF